MEMVPRARLSSASEWWKTASVREDYKPQGSRLSPDVDRIPNRPRLAIALDTNEERAISRTSPDCERNRGIPLVEPPGQPCEDALEDSDAILNLVSTQYQEALYASKVGARKNNSVNHF